MDEIIAALRGIIDNPDDLSSVPNLVTRLEELQATHTQQETTYQERINSLQQANRNFLAQIPIAGAQPEEPEDDKVTFEDAQAQLLNAMKNVGGN